MHDHVRSNHSGLIDKINDTGAYNDEVLDGLKAAVTDFVDNGAFQA